MAGDGLLDASQVPLQDLGLAIRTVTVCIKLRLVECTHQERSWPCRVLTSAYAEPSGWAAVRPVGSAGQGPGP
jgi:hypothetical protein